MTLINLGQVKLKFDSGSYILADTFGYYSSFAVAFMPAVYPNPSFGTGNDVFTLYKDSASGNVVLYNNAAKSYGYVYASMPYDGPPNNNSICFYNYLNGGGYTGVDNHTLFSVQSLGGNKVELFNLAAWMHVGYSYNTMGSGGSGNVAHPVYAGIDDNSRNALTVEPVGGTNVEVLIMRTAKACSGADFLNADFAGFELNKANFAGVTSIQNADFTNASLRTSQFPGINIGSAKTFAGVDFTGSDLSNVSGAQNGHFAGTRFINCNLSTVDFSGSDLTGANFQSSNLAGANFRGCQLAGVSFQGCDLTKVLFDASPAFSYTGQAQMNFSNATLPFALIGRKWSYFDLRGANIVDLPTASLSAKANPLVAQNCKLGGLENDLVGVQLAHADLKNADLTGLDLQRANLNNAILSSANLQGVILTNADLSEANCNSALFMVPTTAPGSSESNPAILTQAYLANTVLDNAQLQGINMDNVQFFTNQMLSGAASAKNASFVDTRISGAFLVGVDFSGVHSALNGAVMQSSVLVGSKFQNADLSRSESTNENPETTLVSADIRGVLFDSPNGGEAANLDGADLDQAKISTAGGQFETTIKSNYDGKDILISVSYGKTILGRTTDKTTCPDGSQGPCGIG